MPLTLRYAHVTIPSRLPPIAARHHAFGLSHASLHYAAHYAYNMFTPFRYCSSAMSMITSLAVAYAVVNIFRFHHAACRLRLSPLYARCHYASLPLAAYRFRDVTAIHFIHTIDAMASSRLHATRFDMPVEAFVTPPPQRRRAAITTSASR